MDSRKVPLNLPHGWDYDKVFGEQPQSAPLQRDAKRAAPAGLQYAAAQVRIGGAGGLTLPQTATHWPLHLVIGMVLVLLGLSGLALVRRRRAA